MYFFIFCTKHNLWKHVLTARDIAPVKRVPRKTFFLFLHKSMHCRYSFEVPWRSASNQYLEHMLLISKCTYMYNACFLIWSNKIYFEEKITKNVLWISLYLWLLWEVNFTTLSANLTDNKLIFFFLSENRLSHFWVAEWLVLKTLDQEIPGSNPAGGGIQLMTVWRFIAEPFIITIWHKCWQEHKTPSHHHLFSGKKKIRKIFLIVIRWNITLGPVVQS